MGVIIGKFANPQTYISISQKPYYAKRLPSRIFLYLFTQLKGGNSNMEKKPVDKKSQDKDYTKVERSSSYIPIRNDDIVVRTDLGRCTKIKYISNQNKTNCLLKKTKNEYVDTRTGEVKQYNKNKPTSRKSVNRKLTKYEELVLYNFQGNKNELFITLNCREHITDIADIKKFFDRFIRKMRKDYKGLEYIYMPEQTEKGCWHIHLFIKCTSQQDFYIPVEKLQTYWGQGGVYVMRNRNTFKTLQHSKDKRDDRLERFRHFPKGKRMYGKSKGIGKPPKEVMPYAECEELNTDKYKKYQNKTYKVRNQLTDKTISIISTEMYKKIDNDKHKT